MGSLLFAGFVARQVIAAPNGIDQPPEGRESFPAPWIWLLLAPAAVVLIVRFRWHHLPASVRRPEIIPPFTSIALVPAMLLLGAIGLSLAQRIFGVALAGEDGAPLSLVDQARLGFGAYVGQTLVAVGYAWRLAVVSRVRIDAAERQASIGGAAGIGVAAILVGWPLVNAVGWAAAVILLFVTGSPPGDIAHETLVLLVESPRDVWFAAMVGQVLVAAPVLEELLYRGLLQDGLRRFGLGPWPAIAATSAVFAAMHWPNTEPHAVVGLFVLSLCFGWAFERTGRLTASIVMHVLFNAGNLAAALLLA